MEDLFVAGYSDIAEAGFPDVLCPVIFLEGCNFKCPYCLNAKLVKKENNKKIPIDFIVDKYKEEDKILISGGEPLCNPNIYKLINKLKNHFKIRISTNGSFPAILSNLISSKLVSFVAMDIKTGFCDLKKWSAVSNEPYVFNNILKSIDILNQENVDYEFRTTLFPELVDEKDIVSISNKINPDSFWYLQQFRLKETLLGGNFVGKVKPYEMEQLKKLVNIARQKIKNTSIRDV